MKEIILLPLTYKKVALIDDEDFERLSKFNWSYHIRNKSVHCAACISGTGRYKDIPLACEVLQLDIMIDHKDGNKLNNQKSNLRVCTRAQNNQNRKKLEKTASKYKGVSFYTRSKNNSWRANIGFLNIFGQPVQKYLGLFVSEEEAAKAYDDAARYYHKEFARLNFPQEGEQGCL